MNRDDIIRMAKEAGWTGPEENVTYVAMLERFANLVAAEEREWQGLTDEEIRGFEIWLDDEEEKHGWNPPADIVKYIEAKLKEKNT